MSETYNTLLESLDLHASLQTHHHPMDKNRDPRLLFVDKWTVVGRDAVAVGKQIEEIAISQEDEAGARGGCSGSGSEEAEKDRGRIGKVQRLGCHCALENQLSLCRGTVFR